MPIYRPLGEKLFRKEELFEIQNDKNRVTGEIEGIPLSTLGEELGEFSPVGVNKPLLVEIRHVYTGEFPVGRFGFFSPNDMLVTSAFRSLSTFNAKPRAINFLKHNIENFFNMRNPSAGEDGTPVVFYSPALTEPNSIMDIEIVFDNFDSELIEGIGAAFSAAAGIPLFAAYSTHLLAAGAVTKLAGKIGERLFDGKPSFAETVELSFARGGSALPVEGFHIITEEKFVPEQEGCIFDSERGRLIDKDEMKEYQGPNPYVVISLDGQDRPEYKKFAPTAASAALLEKFYHMKEGQEQSIDLLMEAVNLYNDVQYKRKADAITAKMATIDEGSEDYARLVDKKEAFIANLITDVFD